MSGMLWWILSAVAIGALFELWSRRSLRRGAQGLLATMETLYQGAHEYRATSLDNYPYIDRRFYESVTASLRQAGFAELGDVEDVTVSSTGPGLPTAIRVMVSADGTVTAGVFHVKVAGLLGLLLRAMRLNPVRIVDLETAIDDGRFMTTSNAPLVGNLAQPPELFAEFLPPSTSVSGLLARHQERLAEHLRGHRDSRPMPARSLVEVLRHQERLEEIKARFRKARPGMVSADEIARLGGKRLGGVAEDLSEEMIRQQAAGRQAGARSGAAPPPVEQPRSTVPGTGQSEGDRS